MKIIAESIPSTEFNRVVKKYFEVVDGKDTDLCMGKPIFAIHLENVRETKEW